MMCGQTGIIFGNAERSPDDLEYFRELFQRLLLLNRIRGPHATGVAAVNTDGSFQLLKRPLEAAAFTLLPEYGEFMNSLKPDATLLMGHTRLATVGSVEKTENAHPIRSGNCLGTVNGTIFNADTLFRRFGLTRFAEVDSELIVRLADKCAPGGKIQVEKLLECIKHCRGQLAAVLTSLAAPREVVILKGNKPLSLFFNPEMKAIIYSSENTHIMTALRGDKNWIKLNLPHMTCAVFDVEDLISPQIHRLKFITQSRRNRL
jgi:glucosamine 6-phosphate synthetase-like amidotransferase/phosphosugar isomerase protein